MVKGVPQERGVTSRRLLTILQRYKDSEVYASRASVLKENTRLYDQIKQESTIVLDDGEEWTWEFLHPTRLLRLLIDNSPDLRLIYARQAAIMKQKSWKLVIAFDEYIPGSKFHLDSNRKAMNLSFNFLNLGLAVLSNDATWITPITIQSKVMTRIPGGWSNVLRRFLRITLLGDEGLMTAGVPLELDGSIYLLNAHLHGMITDGDGHRAALQWRGASALCPCFRHWNALKLNSNLAHRRPGYVEIDHEHPENFITKTSIELWDDVDSILEGARLNQLGELSNTDLELMKKSSGLSVTEHGLLADHALRGAFDPIQCMRYDWVHWALQDGMVNKCLTLFIDACQRKAGISAVDFEMFLKRRGWTFPKWKDHKMSNIWRIFSSYRRKGNSEDDFDIKASSGEMLTLYALMRHGVETVELPATMAEERSVFLSACKVVDTLLMVKMQMLDPAVGAALLRECLRAYLIRYKRLWGTQNLIPKVHWLFDIAEQMLSGSDEVLLDGFVLERIHLRVKVFAEKTKLAKGMERSVLQRVLRDQLTTLQDSALLDGLLEPVDRHAPRCFSSKKCRKNGRIFECCDVVFRDDVCAQIINCICNDGKLILRVEVFPFVEQNSEHSVKVIRFQRKPVRMDWLAEDVSPAFAWYAGSAYRCLKLGNHIRHARPTCF